jgi:arylsulfatase A-like enzyme
MIRRILLAVLVSALWAAPAIAAAAKPNIVFILSDDLAQGDLGCYGQKLIKTPHLDAMAREGMRFTQAYCGTAVCAPSRSSLMTGLHTGQCPIRANREIQPEGQKPLPEGTYTVARLLKDNGYATACVGKWGMGMFDTTGSPLKVGFDHFFGYNCQRHAHSYFPAYLYNNDQRFPLEGNDGKSVGKTYAQNLIADDTLRFVEANRDKPFFLFYAITLPHGRHEIDDQGIYKNEAWTDQQKNYAAQVTRLDSDIGRLLQKLKDLKIDDNTLVIVAGDNGSSFAPGSEIGKLFDQAMGGRLRGFKRALYEGGLRQACIARWPGVVPAGRVSDEPWAFWDFLPTCAELVGGKLPPQAKTTGMSIVPLLKGGAAPKRDYLYWELHENGQPSLQAARWGNIKAVRNGPSKPIEVYDLAKDESERTNLAATQPEWVKRAEEIFKEAHAPSPDWPLRDGPGPKKNNANAGQGKATNR